MIRIELEVDVAHVMGDLADVLQGVLFAISENPVEGMVIHRASGEVLDA